MNSNEISRREFISLSLGLLAVAAPACALLPSAAARGPSSSSSTQKKILILGAGMAGLSAARALQDSGLYDVTLLEARARLGGRMFTQLDARGQVREEGAAWIHGESGNPLSEICAQYGIETIVADNWSDISTFDVNGELPFEKRKHFDDVYQDILRKLRSDRQTLKESVTSLENDSAHPKKDISLRAALDHRLREVHNAEDKNFLEHLFKVNLEDDYGTDLENVSFLNWDGEKDEYIVPDKMIAHGYGLLVDKISAGLQVVVNTPIDTIDTSGVGVRITAKDGRVFRADQVIVTVPLGVLKKHSLKFIPELPAWKKEAIAKVGFGSFNKVFLSYSEAFWPDSASWLESVRGTTPHIGSFFNLKKFGEGKTLVGLASGRSSDYLQSLSESQAKTWAESSLTCVKNLLPTALDVHCTAWSKEEWTQGSYSYPAVGELPSDRDQIGASVGSTLHFAGEACQHDFYGTVHSAWISGSRMAKKIMAPSVV
jgi:monoamine oxidase